MTRRKIDKASSDEFRKLTTAEAKKLGVSASAERRVLASIKRVTAKTLTISKRQWAQRKLQETSGQKLSLEKAAAARKAGEIKYKSAASQTQAAKQSSTRKLKSDLKKLEKVEHPGNRKHPKGYKYDISENMRKNYFDLRERKLAGEWIDAGDWHGMMDVARALNDPMLEALYKS